MIESKKQNNCPLWCRDHSVLPFEAGLQHFGQFGREGALGLLFTLFGGAVCIVALLIAAGVVAAAAVTIALLMRQAAPQAQAETLAVTTRSE